MSRYATFEERLTARIFDRRPIVPALNITARRVGGLWFWRVGRFGGSVYLARRA